ncbi:MAG: class I SAM-dependent methyltransferase [Patescibacteria group bacterium]|nr:class I SAM-dependent methyltransferase [Patescibacteria group bacterium]
MTEIEYKKSFELFLKRTDEKGVILKFIRSRHFLNRNIEFLDIGSGKGSLALSISPHVRNTTIIEPNSEFVRKSIPRKMITVINKKWEHTKLTHNFDFILMAYVFTYFKPKDRSSLIAKAYKHLKPQGRLLILSIDSQKGSWRGIHSLFYKLMSLRHRSSDDALTSLLSGYNPYHTKIITTVSAYNVDEMLRILWFDFGEYPMQFKKYNEELVGFLKRHRDRRGKITLKMVHNAFIITKK